MADGIPILPDDMIQSILERLPVKSLMRFQCVCRQWRILFKTQYFITNHLHHSNHQNPCLLLQRYGIHNPSNFYCLDSEMQVLELQKPPLLNSLKQVKVYSLSTGAWKEVEFRFNDTVGLNSRSVTVNGVMFWLVSQRFGEDTENRIVSFDLAAEVFKVIPIPVLQPFKLTVYEEKLVIFSRNKNSAHSAIDMWVTEKGVGASGERLGWTKKYTSSPNPCLLNPTCFLNPTTIWRNEIVCCPLGEEESTVLLNPTTGKMKKFAISKCDYGRCVSNYAESLIPVGGMKVIHKFSLGSGLILDMQSAQ
ncbi:hypothetical protein K1719_001900 [Acacia pycnantha]|nr:hypothetical protein K1719_001900 [Acacia pycnantha]